MRLTKVTRLILVPIIVALPWSALAQSWIKYANEPERFIVNLPRDPDALEIDYTAQSGVTMPARVYSVEDSESRYSVTVVDYTMANEVHAAHCRALSYECDGREARADILGSVAWEAWNIRRRDNGEITYDAFGALDGVPGHQLQIIHPDRSHSFIGIYLHARRLYVLEGTVPGEDPPPGLFQQSLGILDAEGKRIRFEYDTDGHRTRVDVSYEWVGIEDPVTGEPQAP